MSAQRPFYVRWWLSTELHVDRGRIADVSKSVAAGVRTIEYAIPVVGRVTVEVRDSAVEQVVTAHWADGYRQAILEPGRAVRR